MGVDGNPAMSLLLTSGYPLTEPCPALALPYPTLLYHFFTDQRMGVAIGVLAQLVWLYIFESKQLNPPVCTECTSEVDLTWEAFKIILFQPITVYSTNRLLYLLSLSSLSLLRSFFYLLFLENPQVILSLNYATLLPDPIPL